MYQSVGDKELTLEVKVAAQERQKMFLQEIEQCLIAPLPPAAEQPLGRTEK